MKNYQQVKQAGTPYDSHIRKTADKYGINYDLMHKLIYIESKFNPKAVSPTGAKGIAQFVTYTGKAFGLKTEADRFDPWKSIDAAGQYLSHLAGKLDGDEALMALAYNQGLGGSGRKQVEAAKRGDWSGVKPEGLKYMQNLSDTVAAEQFGRYNYGVTSTPLKPQPKVEGKPLEQVKTPSVPEVAPVPVVPFQRVEDQTIVEPTITAPYSQVAQEQGYKPDDTGFFEGTATAVSNELSNSLIGSAFRIRSEHGLDVLKSFYRPNATNSYQFTEADYQTIRDSELPATYVNSLGGAQSPEQLATLIADAQARFKTDQETAKTGTGAQLIGGLIGAVADPISYVPIAGQAAKVGQGVKLVSKAGLARYGSMAAQTGIAAAGSEALRETFVGTEANYGMAIASGGLLGAGMLKGLDAIDGLAMRRRLARLEANETARNLDIESDAKLPQIVGDDSIPTQTIDGVNFKDNPVGDGSIVLDDGSIVSADSPLNPKLQRQAEEVEKSAWGVQLGGYTEIGLKVLSSNSEVFRKLGLEFFRSPTGLQSGASGLPRAVVSDILDMNNGRDRLKLNNLNNLFSKLFDDPEFTHGSMTKEVYLDKANRRVWEAIDKPEKYLAGLSKVERDIYDATKELFDSKFDDLKNPAKFGNTSATPLLKESAFDGRYTPVVYDDTIRTFYTQMLGGRENLQEAIKNSFLYGDHGYYTDPQVKARVDKREIERYEAEQEARLIDQARKEDAYRDSPEYAKKLKEQEDAKKKSEAKKAARQKKLEAREREVKRVRDKLNKEIEAIRAKYAPKKPAKVEPKAKDPLTPTERKQYDVLTADRKTVESQLALEKNGSFEYEQLVDELAEINLFAQELEAKIDAAKRAPEVKAEADAAAKQKMDAEIAARTEARQAEIKRVEDAKKAMVDEIRKADKEEQAKARELEKLAKQMERQKTLEAKMTLSPDELKARVEKLANDTAYGISNAGEFSYSAAVSDAMDNTGKGLETNNFLEARHPFDGDSTIVLADGKPFKLNDMRSFRADRIIPSYLRRVNGDVAVMAGTGKSMADVKKMLNDTNYASSMDGNFKADGEAFMSALTRIGGLSTIKPEGAGGALFRTLNNITYGSKNAMMGVQNFTEVGAMVVKGHISALLKGVPMLNKMMGGVYANDKAAIDSLHGLLFGKELDDALRPRRADMIEAIRANSSTPNWFNDMAANMQWATREAVRLMPTTMLMQGTTNLIIDAARTATLNDLVTTALRGEGKGFKSELLKSAAVTDDQFKGIQSLIREYITEGADGKLAIKAGIQNDPRAMDLWRLGDHMANEAIQRSGGTSRMTSQQYGAAMATIMQFKSFVLRSLNSTFLKSLYESTKNHRAIEQALTGIVSVGLAGLFWGARVSLNAQGMTESDRKAYLDRNLTPEMTAYAAMTRARGIGAPLSVASTLGGAISPDFDAARAVRTTMGQKRADQVDRPEGFTSASNSMLSNALDQIPAAGYVANALALGKNTAGYLGAKGQGERLEWTDATYNSLRNLIPNDPLTQRILSEIYEQNDAVYNK